MYKEKFFVGYLDIIHWSGCSWAIIIFFMVMAQVSFAQQVEHNYQVGPQQTNCDSLKMEQLSEREAIDIIRQSKFRFEQDFRLTRRQGFQGGEFYSCDASKGFMVIKHNGEEKLFVNVSNDQWDALTKSNDPEGYFQNILDKLQPYVP